jgi:hypothetical protein
VIALNGCIRWLLGLKDVWKGRSLDNHDT